MDSLAISKNATDEYWFFEREINEETCNKIIALAKDWRPAEVLPNLNQEGRTAKDQRITDIAWTNEQWLYEIVWHYLNVANNNSGWNFQIDSCETMQIARYNKDGHFKFHQDGNGFTRFENGNKFTHNKTRKLSMSIILNDEYEGGEFEFFAKDTVISKRGTIIVFPSYMQHRVKPVTKGTRYSLVIWFCGEPFV
jgi:PKHD-type hydroxylase